MVGSILFLLLLQELRDVTGESRDLTQAFKLARLEAKEKVEAMILQLLAAAPTVFIFL
jgi:hypothetical protein